MTFVNIHEAKTHLSRLLSEVAQGKTIVLARNGKPVARLVPYTREERKPGRLKGRIKVSPDFDSPLPLELRGAFEGDGD